MSSVARNLWWVFAVPFVLVAVGAEAAHAADLAAVLVFVSGFSCAVVVALVAVRSPDRAGAAFLAVGLLAAAVGNLISRLWVTGPQYPIALQALVVIGHLLQGYGLMRWMRARQLRGGSVSAAWLLLAGCGVALWAVVVVAAGGRVEVLADARVAGVLRLAVDVAILVVLMQVSFVTARRNRAFILARCTFSFHVAASVVLLIAAWHGRAPTTLFRTFATIAFVLAAATVLHPDFGRHPRDSADVTVNSGAYRVIEIATTGLAVAVAPGLVSLYSLEDLARLVIVAALVVVILVRSDQALRDLEREAAEARFASTHDALTGLPNSTALVADLQEPEDTTLLLVVIDGVKTVLDGYGYAVGEEALRQVSQRIRIAVADRGRTYRHDGDAFAVLIRGTPAPARAVADNVVAAVAQSFRLGSGRVALVARVGVASRGDRTLSAAELIREADSAADSAHDDGTGGVVVFDNRLRAEAVERLEVSARLRDSLDSGAFELYYQPIVATVGGGVAAFEALIRWRDGDVIRGPDDFMGIAEASGMILEIGDWVLETAIADIERRWRCTTCRQPVAVNVSARQLRDPALPARVDAALARRGVPPAALWIELTETALIADTENAARVLSELAALGVRISLDDFGVGYSALSHLSSFPISVVKIDKSFVAALRARCDGDQDAQKRRVVVGAIVSMAEQLGLETVAEGVEDVELDARIRELGCTYAQGWLHGRPEPVVACA
ncbi:putative bifunctional diguanylate cyclase/phosphodiesterase [Tsukamurella soli]|uniref:putative bifunctional diguanylate cyclase/phosphodiesterase n=1 Tax=Tsukamurella soli TaxID=644556 RepID=UPI0031EA9368